MRSHSTGTARRTEEATFVGARRGAWVGMLRLGDNGLVTVVVGRHHENEVHLDLWLMSCRVLKRDLELAMLDEVVARTQALGLSALRGTFLRTPKNGLVADHYEKLGFDPIRRTEHGSEWRLDVARYIPKNKHIKEVDRG